MNDSGDTSVFDLLTARGPAAIATIRLVGPYVATWLSKHVQFYGPFAIDAVVAGQRRRAALLDEFGEVVDDVLVTFHAAYPRLDLRLYLHGSPRIVSQCRRFAERIGFVTTGELQRGILPASDWIEAEVCALLPHLPTFAGASWLAGQPALLRALIARAKAAVRTPEISAEVDSARARSVVVDWYRRPVRIALIGPPNAGKSTLINALADRRVSLVSSTSGTTRDWIEASADIGGFPAMWIDTAGLREGANILETAGIERTRSILATADAIIVVLDARASELEATRLFCQEFRDLKPACVAVNKCDDLRTELAGIETRLPPPWEPCCVATSGMARIGLRALCDRVLKHLGRDASLLSGPAAFSARIRHELDAAVLLHHLRP